MSNARTISASRPPSRRSGAPPTRRAPWLWLALGLTVVLAAVVAVAVSSDSGPTATAGIEETRDVEVTGSPLAPFGSGTDPAIGQPAPRVSGASFDGTPVVIGGGDEGMVLAFVAHWCPHCQVEVPLLSEHLATNPMPAGVRLVTVATSTNVTRPNYPPSAWLEREEWPGEVLADSAEGASASAFGLTAFPYFVAVDPAGDVVARVSGEISTEQFDELTALAMGTAG
jgi:cytochrome c biogenesis protein CcmG/thiol:disulfide interchange protein DsbE